MTPPALPRLIEASRVSPTPWKNGGGTQRDLFRIPDRDDWRIRVSLAAIACDGPFSRFPGVTRHLAIVAGAGLRLRIAGLGIEVDARSAVTFDGASDCTCALVQGPCDVLNLMLRGLPGGLCRTAPGAAHTDVGLQALFASEPGHMVFDHAATRVPARTLAWFGRASTATFTGNGWWIHAGGAA